jgi:hypothetical protein
MPHARLSPSSANRWMNCPGSVHMTVGRPNTAGPAAMMGTAAHKVIEVMLKKGEIDALAYKGYSILVYQQPNEKAPSEKETMLFAPGQEIGSWAFNPNNGWHLFPCDDNMVYGVQMFVDEVERVKAELFDPELYTERYMDMTWLRAGLGGTADVTLVEAFGWIHLFDYKNGRVLVEHEDNEQMLNYAVGLLHEHPDALGVVIHLIQPNSVHEQGFVRPPVELTADEIKIFEIQLKAAAEATDPPNATLRAGDWCQYCAAKIDCKEFAGKALKEAMDDFDGLDEPPEGAKLPTPTLVSDPNMFDDMGGGPGLGQDETTDGDAYRAALCAKARWIPLLDQWARDIHGKIQAELTAGRKVGDWKLVEGQSKRKFKEKSPEFVGRFADASGIPLESLYEEPEMKSPAQVQKLLVGTKGDVRNKIKEALALDRSEHGEGLENFVIKPPGKITAVPGSDSRDPVDLAELVNAEFEGLDDQSEDFV